MSDSPLSNDEEVLVLCLALRTEEKKTKQKEHCGGMVYALQERKKESIKHCFLI